MVTGAKKKMQNTMPSCKNFRKNLVKSNRGGNGKSSKPYQSLLRLGTQTNVDHIITKWIKISQPLKKLSNFYLKKILHLKSEQKNMLINFLKLICALFKMELFLITLPKFAPSNLRELKLRKESSWIRRVLTSSRILKLILEI